MKAYEWLKATVKKPETRAFLFFIIWFIGGLLVIALIYDSFGIVAYIISVLLWSIVSLRSYDMCFDMYLQRTDLEKWVYSHIRNRWKFIEKPLSTLPSHLSWVSLLIAIIFTAFIIVGLAICLAIDLTVYFVRVLWIICDGDVSKFGENINNYMSIILVLIFLAQAGIFYQQYRHMKQPLFKTPLFWTLSKSKSDTDCGILLKNGGNVPIFNISYQVSEVLVKDRWGYKGYKKVKSEEISKDFLPRLDGGSEKEIFEKPTEVFKEMRLAVYLIAKTLEGNSTRLFFYKARGAMDFRLAGIIRI